MGDIRMLYGETQGQSKLWKWKPFHYGRPAYSYQFMGLRNEFGMRVRKNG